MKKLKRLWKKLMKFLGINKKRYGWTKDKHDIRDRLFKDVLQPTLNVNSSELPLVVNLMESCPPVYNQDKLGSCTANAIGAALQFNQIKENKKYDFMPSRLFIYYNEREMEGNINKDSGATIRAGMKSVNTHGVCKEELCPYDISLFKIKPSEEAYKEAVLHKSVQYARLNSDLRELKHCLAGGFPFIFGFIVFDYFESKETALSSFLRMPKQGELPMGGHAVLCVGYDDTRNAFLIRNSWGEEWGYRGHFWMPYEYVTNKQLAMDFWVITDITDIVPTSN